MIATADIQRCTAAEWEEFRKMAAHGMLFEVAEWIDQGKPTLRPEKKHTSAFESALMAPNLSMTQVLWERAWQERDEAERAVGQLAGQPTSDVVMRYLLENGCPVDHVTGYDLCMSHDLALIKLGIARGVSLLEPDGWASAFIDVGSRPLIRLYLEQRNILPGLKKDAISVESSYPTLEVSELPARPVLEAKEGKGAEEVVIPAKTLESLSIIAGCASNDATRYVLNGVLFTPDEGGRLVATDGRRLGCTPAVVPSVPFILPNPAVSMLAHPDFTGSDASIQLQTVDESQWVSIRSGTRIHHVFPTSCCSFLPPRLPYPAQKFGSISVHLSHGTGGQRGGQATLPKTWEKPITRWF